MFFWEKWTNYISISNKQQKKNILPLCNPCFWCCSPTRKKKKKKKNPHNQPALQWLCTLIVRVFRAPADLNKILPVQADLPCLRHVPVSKSHLRRWCSAGVGFYGGGCPRGPPLQIPPTPTPALPPSHHGQWRWPAQQLSWGWLSQTGEMPSSQHGADCCHFKAAASW